VCEGEHHAGGEEGEEAANDNDGELFSPREKEQLLNASPNIFLDLICVL